jgi:O-antigen/teichoic acid export membrane protein
VPASALLGMLAPGRASTTRSDRLVANTAWMCARSGLRLVLHGASFVVVARVLGAAGYGEFIAVAALAAMLAPFGSFGTGNLLVRNVSRDPATLAESWNTALVTTAASGLLLTTALFVIATYAVAGTPVALVVLVGVADLVFAQFSDICGKAFQARQRLDVTASLDTMLSAAKVVAALGLVAVVAAPTPVIWAWFYAGANAAAALVSIGVVYALHGRLPLRLSVTIRAAREGLFFALSQWAQAFHKDIDKMLIVRFSGLQAAGIYAAAARIVEVAFTPVYSLLAATYPGFFRHGAAGIGATMAFARPFVLGGALYGLGIGLALALAAPVLPHVLGDSFAGSVEAMQWLALLPLLRALHYVAGDVLTGAGYQRLRTCLQVVVGGAVVGLAVWAIPRYSWRGAAGAAVASNALLVAASWAAIVVMRRRS